MRRTLPVVGAILLASFGLSYAKPNTTQEKPASTEPKMTPEDAAKKNPVPPTPEGLAEVRKLFGYNCAMCHGKDGDGKGEVAKDMKLQIVDFTDPGSLKDRTDGELFYIIKNGHDDMPPEGPRVKTEENWDLVNYVRSLARKKPEAQEKPQS